MMPWRALLEWVRSVGRKNQEVDVRVLVVVEGGRQVSLEGDERARYVANNLIRRQNGRSA